MQTEARNPNTIAIDQLSTLNALRLINDEDATVPGVVRSALPEITRAVDVIVDRFRRGGRLIYVGAGTSGRLAVLDAAECVPTFNVDPSMVQAVIAGGPGAFVSAVEGAEDDRDAGRGDLLARDLTANDAVVGIAASGRTPYVIAALETALEVGAATIAISCNAPAPLLDAADIKIAAVTGPEVIAGSTRLKAGTAQKLILNMLSTASMIQLGKVYGNRMVDLRVTNQKLIARARRMVVDVTGVSDDEAARLLTEANQHVKTAIAMARLGISAAEARYRLDQVGGKLSALIGESQ